MTQTVMRVLEFRDGYIMTLIINVRRHGTSFVQPRQHLTPIPGILIAWRNVEESANILRCNFVYVTYDTPFSKKMHDK